MSFLDNALQLLRTNFSGNWANQYASNLSNDDPNDDQVVSNLTSVIAANLDIIATDLFSHLNLSVLGGEYVIDLLDYRQKLDEIENLIQTTWLNLEIPGFPNMSLLLQQLFDSNFYSSVIHTVKKYRSLLDFVKRHLVYQSNTSEIFYVFRNDVDTPKDSAAKNLDELFDLNIKLARIDHSLSFRKDYFTNLIFIQEQLKRIGTLNPCSEVLSKKCAYLLYKISFRLKQSQKNYLYAIDFNYSTIQPTTVTEFEKYNDIINGHYENGFPPFSYEQRRNNALHKLHNGQQLELDDFHALIKYFKDDKPDLNKLKQLRIPYEVYRTKHYASASLYDQKAFEITFCYLENNILSLELDQREFTLSNWKSKLKEYTDRADNFQNKNFFPYYKIITEFLTKEISNQFLATEYDLKVIRELIDNYQDNLTKLVENVGICEETNYLTFQCTYDNCIVYIKDSNSVARSCFISSSFVLPINYRNYKEELEKYKAELNKFNSMYEIQRMIDADRKDVRAVKRDIEKADKRHIEILSIFAALVMFVSNEIQIFTKIPNMADAVAYTLFFAYGLGLFVLMIWFITRPEGVKWTDLSATHKWVMGFFSLGFVAAIVYVVLIKSSNPNQKRLDYLQFRIDSIEKARIIDTLTNTSQKEVRDTILLKKSNSESF